MIITQFLDMCITEGKIYFIAKCMVCVNDCYTCTITGKESATAAGIFGQLEHVFETNGIPWVNYVGAGVDNT